MASERLSSGKVEFNCGYQNLEEYQRRLSCQGDPKYNGMTMRISRHSVSDPGSALSTPLTFVQPWA